MENRINSMANAINITIETIITMISKVALLFSFKKNTKIIESNTIATIDKNVKNIIENFDFNFFCFFCLYIFSLASLYAYRKKKTHTHSHKVNPCKQKHGKIFLCFQRRRTTPSAVRNDSIPLGIATIFF